MQGWDGQITDLRDGMILSCVWLWGWGHPLFHVCLGTMESGIRHLPCGLHMAVSVIFSLLPPMAAHASTSGACLHLHSPWLFHCAARRWFCHCPTPPVSVLRFAWVQAPLYPPVHQLRSACCWPGAAPSGPWGTVPPARHHWSPFLSHV